MNERIKELAQESFFDEATNAPSDKMYTLSEAKMQKFAELIIQECMGVALAKKKWVEDQRVFDPRDLAWNKARVQIIQHIVNKIKEHFGVK